MRKTTDYIVTFKDSYLGLTWDYEITAHNKREARKKVRQEIREWAKWEEYPAPAKIARTSHILDIQRMEDLPYV